MTVSLTLNKYCKKLGRKKNKYNAEKKTVDGITFASGWEAEFYKKLRDSQKWRLIDYFLMQVPFRLPGGVIYRVDFQVFNNDGSVQYIDAKGVETELFKVKKKQVEDLYGVEIEIVKKARKTRRRKV